MIRRGCWLALGAVLGVTGYRRAIKLARAMLPGRGQPGRGLPGRGQLARAGLGTLGALSGRGMLGGGARIRRTAIGGGEPAGRAAGFLRDVREGRAEYLDRHPVQRGPTLEGQQVRDQPPHEPGRARGIPGIDYAKDGR
jgi:hypothetical protein